MDIKEKSPEDLLWAVRSFRDPAPEGRATYRFPPSYTIFLGAGASVEAGIPTAHEMVISVLRSRRDHKAIAANSAPVLSDEEIEEWAKENHYYDPSENESMYAQIMNKVFDTKASRDEFVRRELRKAIVSSGYRILGELIELGVFATILTTNFDQLIRQGADAPERLPIVEVDSAEQYGQLNPYLQEPRIVRLHGDFWHSNIRNTEDELRNTPRIIYDAARKLFGVGGLIVIGYAGEDSNLMKELFHSDLWDGEPVFPHGLYWCDIKEKDQLSSRVKEFLLKGSEVGRAFYVKLEGFNKLMEQFAGQYKVPVSRELDYLQSTRECWEWLALLSELCLEGGSGGRERYLERLVQLLGADKAVCISQSHDSADWEVHAYPNALLPKARRASVSRSLTQLHRASRDYESMSPGELSEKNIFYEFLSAGSQIESFPVWSEDHLQGLVSFSFSKRPLISQPQLLLLIRAAVDLLVRP